MSTAPQALTFDQTKNWLQSTTIRSAIVALISMFTGIFFKNAGITPENITAVLDALTQIVSALAMVWAIIGRLTATTKLTAAKTVPNIK